MNNKLRFIMPRLAGATAAAGLAALVITAVFKLLLGLTLLAGAMTLIARSIAGRRKLSGHYGQDAMPDFGRWNAVGNSNAGINPIQLVSGYATRKGTSIVPIN
jgi:hypothetical protein